MRVPRIERGTSPLPAPVANMRWCERKESDLRPPSYQDGVLPLNYARIFCYRGQSWSALTIWATRALIRREWLWHYPISAKISITLARKSRPKSGLCVLLFCVLFRSSFLFVFPNCPAVCEPANRSRQKRLKDLVTKCLWHLVTNTLNWFTASFR